MFDFRSTRHSGSIHNNSCKSGSTHARNGYVNTTNSYVGTWAKKGHMEQTTTAVIFVVKERRGYHRPFPSCSAEPVAVAVATVVAVAVAVAVGFVNIRFFLV